MSLETEAPYAFRDRLREVHRQGRRDPAATPAEGEVEITAAWRIVYQPTPQRGTPTSDSDLLHHTATDLQDYFLTSMGISLPLDPHDVGTGPAIRLQVAPVGEAGDERSHRIEAGFGEILLQGQGKKGVARAGHYLEELLNLRGGPYLAVGSLERTPLFYPRMSHSGYGVDEFPEDHLAQLAHLGMDAILLFISAPNHTPDGATNRGQQPSSKGRFQRTSEIARRAARHGLDLYLYAYFHADRPVHPDDPQAERFYAETYGSAFEACPEAKGIVLVGESVEFPSRDSRTTGRMRRDPVPGNLPADKPSPGWWPCEDYPQWVSLVRDSCRRHRPDAEIIFWTYNWGWAPEPDRIALINSIPDDVTVQATFEMFDKFSHDGVSNVCVDYTASRIGPGPYFASEAAAVHQRTMRLATMANTGGLTWDIGVVPYQPIPYHWAQRHAAIRQAHHDWGLAAVMENHHYGLWPSFIAEMTNAAYHEPAPDSDALIAAIARRDFGPGADQALLGWQEWSRAWQDYIPTNADQYGPFRIGPAYPLTLFTNPRPPAQAEALFGDEIVRTPYQPEQGGSVSKTAPVRRVPAEILSLERLLARWRVGTEHLARAAELTPTRLRHEADRMVNLGRYIEHCVVTTINAKRWWLAKTRLLAQADLVQAENLVSELTAIGTEELANAEAARACVLVDSRLGWEPSMEYLGDAAHIDWKLAHLRHTLATELPRYLASLHE